MTEISPEHIEWATVDRMRRMLRRPHPSFEVTGTFALFTGILCWTMQRIRTKEDDSDIVSPRMVALSASLSKQDFRSFLKTEPREVLTTTTDGAGRENPVALNSLADFTDNDEPLKARRSLVALRNAVGHGDARNLTPLNHRGLLIGYRFACNDSYRNDKNEWVEKWSGSICLDAAGMASIAGEIADQFCAALQEGSPRFESDARSVREAQTR